MSAFKILLKHLFLYFAILCGTYCLLISSDCNAQDTIVKHPFSLKIDTITKVDTTYIIDTVINTYQFIKIDTIYANNDTMPETKTKKELRKEARWHKFEGNFGVTLNQLAVTQWASGGESNGSGKISSDFKYTYNRRLFNYVTSGVFAYGICSYSKDKRVEKSEDRCELSMTMTHNNKKHLTFTSIAALKTQFTDGFKYPNDSIPISRFFAPAYATISIGYTLNIKDIVSIFGSPAAGKLTFVTDQTLADLGAFGVEAGYWNIINGDSTWVKGKNFLGELGINILIKYQKTFKNNITIFSNLNLYNNYMDANRSNRWNIDVDWETGITFIINKQISSVINVHLVYDNNVTFPYSEIVDGTEIIRQKPMLQFKESLGITFLYKFATN